MSEPIFSLPDYYVGNYFSTLSAAPTSWAMSATFIDQLRLMGCDGEGEEVGIIDTGIDPNHREFAGKITEARSFVPGESVFDRNGHGTHVAGTAAGLSSQISFAPRAKLRVAKALSDSGSGGISGIRQAMQWMIDSKVGAVGLSIGGHGFLEGMEDLFALANSRGILVCVAAGNERQSGGVVRVNSSGLVVAAHDRLFRIAGFSNPGAVPAFIHSAAPGVDIVSAWTGGGYNSIAGTSMAQPATLGFCVAFNSGRVKLGLPRWNTSQFKAGFDTRSVDAGSPGRDRDFGPGVLDGHMFRNLLIPNPPEVK